MVMVELSSELKPQSFADILASIFNETCRIYADEDLIIVVEKCDESNAYNHPGSNKITISIELIETMYAFTMASWLFYHKYTSGNTLHDLTFSDIAMEEEFITCVGYYKWATQKYQHDYNTEFSYNDIIQFPVIISILSKVIAFVVGHEMAHKMPTGKAGHSKEFECDIYSLTKIINYDPKGLFPFFYSICTTFLYFTAVQVSTNIAFTQSHPDPWIRLQNISEHFGSVYEEIHKKLLRNALNVFRDIKLPDKQDSLFGHINSILILTIMLEKHELIANLQKEYETHEQLAKDLFKQLSDYKATCR